MMINGIQDRPLFLFPFQDMVAPETANFVDGCIPNFF